MRHPPNHFFEHTRDSLRQWCESIGWPAFRANQLLEWVYKKNTVDPAAMTNLSKLERDLLTRDMTFLSGEIVSHQSASDGTQKLLVEWSDVGKAMGHHGFGAPSHANIQTLSAAEEGRIEDREVQVHESEPGTSLSLLPATSPASGDAVRTDRQTECVMIPAPPGSEFDSDRRTACISSQVGCPVGCAFCASGLGGLEGNLSAGRIVEQVWRLQQLPNVGRISNIVFMGMGEPLANFSAVVKAIRTITAPWGMGIGARKITLSTVGLPKAIEKLAAELDLPITLALSLHAPTDELRRQLIPWAQYSTIAELLAACQKWFEKTKREITLEYTLLGGINDSAQQAEQLAALAKTLRANINLIRYNEVKGLPFKRPNDDDVRRFQDILRARDINAHIRASRGRDIAAACGQLRHEKALAG
ncbi:MAG TPA: 23S rRNA (adenine(2503)-C(2))-methyltransferase RlmN [Phycisphaerales bacterium]|nr:23S rRNA (adenine(2503)-C(2))-methyltransferase RlmN [Phycisphaerales bacterium]